VPPVEQKPNFKRVTDENRNAVDYTSLLVTLYDEVLLLHLMFLLLLLLLLI